MSLTSGHHEFVSIPPRPRGGIAARGLAAFTLIELLVVISIIAILASLVLGVSGVASRKGREARIRGELNRLITVIESYKGRLGFYPPCHQALENADASARAALAGVNQLYYELTGTLFDGTARVFFPIGRDQSVGQGFGLRLNEITTLFGVDGFSNSARSRREVRFTFDFKAREVKKRAANAQYSLLVAPLPVSPSDLNRLNQIPPARRPQTIAALEGGVFYPWLYDSASTNRNNPDGFDLWTEVLIGKKVFRFSNWEPAPVVIGSTP